MQNSSARAVRRAFTRICVSPAGYSGHLERPYLLTEQQFCSTMFGTTQSPLTSYLTIFGSAAAFVIYYWLLKTMQPYQLSSISLIIPLVALIAGLLDGEPVSWIMLIAIIAVLGSVRSVLVAEKEKEPESEDILMLRNKVQ
jgi:drug/metabolite transporter (DMT)-like permease